MADAFGQCERPGSRSIERLLFLRRDLGTAQHGAGTVDQQHAQIDIAALGHATESARGAAGVLARRESEGTGEVTAGREAIEVADRSAERRRGDQADAAGALQALAAQVAFGEGLQMLLDREHLRLGRLDRIEHRL